MPFTDWLLTFTDERSPRSDLAREVGSDPNWPRDLDHDPAALLRYLDTRRVMEIVKRLLVEAWREWYLKHR